MAYGSYPKSVRKSQDKGYPQKRKGKQPKSLVLLPNNYEKKPEPIEPPIDSFSVGPIRTIKKIKPRTAAQYDYVRSMKENMVTVCLAPAGCGKTLFAMNTGVMLFNSQSSPVNQLLYVRVIVDNKEERQIGYLDGNKGNKLAPYARPAIDNCKVFMSDSEAEFLFHPDNRKASIDIPEFLEGRSLLNTFVVFDEAHASCRSTINMVLERLGEGSKLVLIGCPNQRKNKGEDPLESLAKSYEIERYSDWGLIRMTQRDNLRNPTYRQWEAGLNRWLGR